MGTVGMILYWAGLIGCLIFGIQILIMAFKTSIGWGLASLLIPFVMFVYVAKNWAACKTPFLRWLASLVVCAIGGGLKFYGMFSGGMPTGG
ncbi:MAG: hypothetical protein U0X73_09480 [Thermoanaerobaculia bacterium]